LLERDPLVGHALRGRLRGLRSLRVGTFRVIYQLSEDDPTVRVVAIRHRSVAYGRDPR
jgi:mRNA interferase RelE/StbE